MVKELVNGARVLASTQISEPLLLLNNFHSCEVILNNCKFQFDT